MRRVRAEKKLKYSNRDKRGWGGSPRPSKIKEKSSKRTPLKGKHDGRGGRTGVKIMEVGGGSAVKKGGTLWRRLTSMNSRTCG